MFDLYEKVAYVRFVQESCVCSHLYKKVVYGTRNTKYIEQPMTNEQDPDAATQSMRKATIRARGDRPEPNESKHKHKISFDPSIETCRHIF